MTTLLLSFLLVVLAVAGLSIGVMSGRKPLKGSCGGLSSLQDGEGCEFCGGSPDQCEDADRPAGRRSFD
jgi:hypothetical protein